MKNIAWLRSIRVDTKNGYLLDDDCERIDEFYKNQVKKVVEKIWYDIQKGGDSG